MVQFGVRFADWFGNSNRIVELAVLADKKGFDSCWISHDVFMRSSLVTLTAVALNTRKVMLGNTILNPYTLNPAEIAMYLATLDELAEGRVLCGISAGALEYMNWLGLPHSRPLTRTREAVRLIRLLLNGENAHFEGEEFKWTKECYMRFKPQRKGIPIYIGAQGDKMLEFAGAEGDGALPLLYPPEFAGYAVEKIREGAKKAGKDPYKASIAGCIWFSVAESTEEAITQGLKELIAYFGPHLGDKGLGSIGLSRKDFDLVYSKFRESGIQEASKLVDDRMLRLAIYGTPDECISKIERLIAQGVDHVLIGAPLGPDPKKSIEIIGDKIIPYFRGK